MEQLPRKGDIVIGNDVWLGYKCTILPGVTIGDGAIIAAHSVVSRDVSPYCIAAGNPARCVKKRFDDELIALLQQYKWWDLSSTKLLDILPLLCDPDIEKLRKKIRCELHKTDESNLV